jgi:hypothetical protein
MDGKGDVAGMDVEALRRDLQRRMVEAVGAPIEEIERTARAVTTIAKAIEGLSAAAPQDSGAGRRSRGPQLGDEQRHRDL